MNNYQEYLKRSEDDLIKQIAQNRYRNPSDEQLEDVKNFVLQNHKEMNLTLQNKEDVEREKNQIHQDENFKLLNNIIENHKKEEERQMQFQKPIII